LKLSTNNYLLLIDIKKNFRKFCKTNKIVIIIFFLKVENTSTNKTIKNNTEKYFIKKNSFLYERYTMNRK